MGKKNIFIGLSTLLLVLLLGLSTRTYADSYRIWTDDDVKNVIYNYYTSYRNLGETNTTNFIENNQTTIETLVDKLNNSIKFVICSINNYGLVFQFPVAGNPGYYIANNGLQINSRAQGDIAYYLGWNSLSVSTRTNLADFSSWKFNENYLYTTLDIKQNNVIKYAKGFYAPTNMFDGPYAPVEDGIRFIPYPDKISDVYVGQNYDLTAYGCNKNNTYVSMRFGDLIQPPSYLIEEINVTMSYYNRGQSKWIEKYLLIETGEDLVPSNYKSSIANFKWENYDSSTYTITFSAFINNEYVHDDCLYSFTFIGKDTSGTPFYIEQTFYIIGSNTIITDGTLDISFLENGDYSNDYANDLNELASKIDDQNDLINAVEQGNINSWLPGSGDWSALVGLVGSGDDIVNTANLWGFRNYSNSYWTALYEMMNATYTVLSQSGTVSLDVSFHGYNHAITSADIPSPPLPIRNTISLCLITFVMISIYKSFSKKIEKLKMVDTSVLKSEAHDDSDLM